jgi:hypothetical protein
VTYSTPASHPHDPDERVCLLCGTGLAGRRPQARFCGPACRVEAHRISAILRGNYTGPYRSVRERLEAAEKPYKDSLLADERRASTSAIGKLVRS